MILKIDVEEIVFAVNILGTCVSIDAKTFKKHIAATITTYPLTAPKAPPIKLLVPFKNCTLKSFKINCDTNFIIKIKITNKAITSTDFKTFPTTGYKSSDIFEGRISAVLLFIIWLICSGVIPNLGKKPKNGNSDHKDNRRDRGCA